MEQAHPDTLDINFGCPVKRVAGKGAGAGMLQNICLLYTSLHDSTLDRTTNGTGAISQWLSADIDTLDAGSWFCLLYTSWEYQGSDEKEPVLLKEPLVYEAIKVKTRNYKS